MLTKESNLRVFDGRSRPARLCGSRKYAKRMFMRRSSGFRTPIRSVVVVRPGDRFTITGLAATFLKIGAASLLVRAVLAIGALLLLLLAAAILNLTR
jgi:hypothetical protein